MRFAVIQNEAGRPVAVFAHDTDAGRVVLKCKPADWPLQASFDYWIDRPLIVQTTRDLGGVVVQVRKKLVRFDSEYLDNLLDRVVRRPYKVRDVVSSTQGPPRLDQFVDQKAREVL